MSVVSTLVPGHLFNSVREYLALEDWLATYDARPRCLRCLFRSEPCLHCDARRRASELRRELMNRLDVDPEEP